MSLRKYAIIVAGGEGNRAGGSVPKQFVKMGGVPMLWWSVRAFHAEDPATEIILVLHPGFFDDWDILYSELPEADKAIRIKISCGGRTRPESVVNGLMSVPSEDALVAVHDAARPMLTPELIGRGWQSAEEHGAAVPVTPMIDSIRRISGDESESVPRKDYVKVQTPQVFRSDLLKTAYSTEDFSGLTDDASVAERAGHRIFLFEGDADNFKVTTPEDLKIAGILLEER